MTTSARPPVLWISEADVTALMTLKDAIAALENGLGLEAAGATQNMLKTHVAWGAGHTLHAIGAVCSTAGFAGTKTWTHTPHGATPLLILFDSERGDLKAVIEAFALGQMRTGGIAAVATRWLARLDASVLAVIGSGKQALTQVAAVAAVRRLKEVRVFSPTAAHRAQFADRLRATFDCDVTAAPSVSDAVAGAAIITLVTRATAPFLTTDLVGRGAHINAVGAITPERAEFSTDLFPRCERIVADSVPSVQTLSREFLDHFGTGSADWADVVPLSQLVTRQDGRPPGADLTLFKAMGMGLSDLALGIEIYHRAVQRGVRHTVAHPERAAVRFA